MQRIKPVLGSASRSVAAAALATLALSAAALGATGVASSGDAPKYRAWIVEMKQSPRGPFSAIKWFCKDGRVLMPLDYACSEKDQGWQHGEWSDRTRQIRASGYRIATLLAGIEADKLVASPEFADIYSQLLVEKFLVATDGGWILAKAQFYRGAIQEEDEREGARKLLTAMAARPEWIGQRFVALRTGVKMLPHGTDNASAQKVRNQAAALADRDAGFQTLRVKIHGSPDAADAALVREYAAKQSDATLRAQALSLAAEIDRIYAPRPLVDVLESHARAFGASPTLQSRLRATRESLQKDSGPAARYLATSELLATLRDTLPSLGTGALRLRALDLSTAMETENFRAAAELRGVAGKVPRADEFVLLSAAVEAAYGAGMVNSRERGELRTTFRRLAVDQLPLSVYLGELRYLGLVPGWGTQQLRMQFGEAMTKLAEIEPLADLFIQDQLRGSPLLF
ncbi:MAG: hypothetical protein ACREBN_04225, partial [Burkholderiaceae bacterium]